MNLDAKTFDTPSAARLEGTPQSVNSPVCGGSHCCYAMTLPEIAANLGTSLADVVVLEQRAITKAQVWAQKNGYFLEDLLGVRSTRTASRG